MLTTGLTLGVLTAAGFYLIYRKLPVWIKNAMCKYPLITDGIACLLTYAMFGGTIVGLFAAAFVGIIVSIMLAVVNNPVGEQILEQLGKKIVLMKDKVCEIAVSLSGLPEESK